MRRRRRLIVAGAMVVGVAAIGLVAGGIFSRHRGPVARVPLSTLRAGFGSFAGYVWSGRVRLVQASWLVPLIRRASPNGYASTWVGALGHGAPAAFVQIGTTEARKPSSAKHGAENVYYAFWSDTVRGFRAQELFPVEPGDEISAMLRLSGRRWTLALADATSGAIARLSTREETRQSFIAAEWTQEDVVRNATREPVPYPRLSAIHFRQISINDRIPNQTELNSAWMSVNGETLAPSELSGGSFTVDRAPALTAAGARYLEIENGLGREEDAFVTALLRSSAVTRHSAIASASSRFIRALRNFAEQLASSQWPSTVQTQVDSLLREASVIVAETREVGRAAPAELAARRSAWLRDAAVALHVTSTVRRALHVPVVAPAGALAEP